jgi:hypothetical protein
MAWRGGFRITTHAPSIMIEFAGSPLVSGNAPAHNRLTFPLLQKFQPRDGRLPTELATEVGEPATRH